MSNSKNSDKRPPSSTSARVEAARQLEQNEDRGSFVGLSRKDSDMDPGRERQVRDLVAGVTRWHRYLDFLIDSFYKSKSGNLEKALRTVLRIGLYELLFTETPDHAAIHEAVEAAKVHVRIGAAGLTNGLLRSVLRKRDTLPKPVSEQKSTQLGIEHSHPDWMVKRWLEDFGEPDTIRLMIHNNERPTYGIHIVSREAEVMDVLAEAGVEINASEFIPGFWRIRSVQPLLRGGFLKDGSVRVQDEAAAMVVQVVAPQADDRILDMCAAPGGKSLLMAMIMDGKGEVVASDIHKRRLNLLRGSALDQGLENITLDARDGLNPPPSWINGFDKVLLDAPCTGFGVLSKKADMRWNRKESDFEDLTALQRTLLDSAARCVRPGGVLVYSTCTIDIEENHAQISNFLFRNPCFSLDQLPLGFPAILQNEDGYFESLPFNTGMDGAFAARLRKTIDPCEPIIDPVEPISMPIET